jgi:hypothetical protein
MHRHQQPIFGQHFSSHAWLDESQVQGFRRQIDQPDLIPAAGQQGKQDIQQAGLWYSER